VWPILACALATTENANAMVANEVVCGLGLFKQKIGSVGAVFFFCYFYFGQAKEK
jgi:hypothetical protein